MGRVAGRTRACVGRRDQRDGRRAGPVRAGTIGLTHVAAVAGPWLPDHRRVPSPTRPRRPPRPWRAPAAGPPDGARIAAPAAAGPAAAAVLFGRPPSRFGSSGLAIGLLRPLPALPITGVLDHHAQPCELVPERIRAGPVLRRAGRRRAPPGAPTPRRPRGSRQRLVGLHDPQHTVQVRSASRPRRVPRWSRASGRRPGRSAPARGRRWLPGRPRR